MDRDRVQYLFLAGVVGFKSLTFKSRLPQVNSANNTIAEAQVRDRGRATLRVLPVEGVSAAAADGGRVVVSVLVRSVRGFEPGDHSGDYDSDDHRVRARDLIDPPRVPYLTFADAFFLACYIFAFLAMLEVTAVHIAYRNERRDLARGIRRTARWLVPAAFVVSNSILVLHFLIRASGTPLLLASESASRGTGPLLRDSRDGRPKIGCPSTRATVAQDDTIRQHRPTKYLAKEKNRAPSKINAVHSVPRHANHIGGSCSGDGPSILSCILRIVNKSQRLALARADRGAPDRHDTTSRNRPSHDLRAGTLCVGFCLCRSFRPSFLTAYYDKVLFTD